MIVRERAQSLSTNYSLVQTRNQKQKHLSNSSARHFGLENEAQVFCLFALYQIFMETIKIILLCTIL
jgi:hypothetical protein